MKRIRGKSRIGITGRLAALALALSLALAGCSAGGGERLDSAPGAFSEEQDKGPGQDKTTAGQEGSPAAMGRYAEQEIPYEENSSMQQPAALQVSENGLYLLDVNGMDARVEFSENPTVVNINRKSELPGPLYTHIANEAYITEMAMAENGARMYTVFRSDKENPGSYFYEKYFLDGEGNETPWDAEGAVSRECGVICRYGNDGYFYVMTKDEERRLYRVDSKSGETKYLAELADSGDRVSSITVFGGRLFAAAHDKLRIFDLATMEETGDEVLNELIGDGFQKNNGDYANGYLLYPGKDDSIYVATEQGLYRHVLYGSISEQMIDGTLCSLGDISKLFTDMYVDEEGENGMPVFYFLYDDGSLRRFAYDPEMPSVPEKTITLYSLMENNEIRLAITAYQALHPETYVRYEIGMSGNDGTTRADALNSLATRIAAGEGPDVFLLDNLPYRSYAGKGVLMDLSGLYGEIRKERNYFDNVVGALREGEKLYTIPMLFHVPLLAGDKGTLDGITDAESLVQAVEATSVSDRSLRAGLLTAETTLRSMSYTNSGSWLDGDGRLDKEALQDFLGLCKRLYEADRADISRENLELRMGMYRSGDYIQTMYQISRDMNSAAMDRNLYQDKFVIGLQGGDIRMDFNMFCSLLESTEADYKLLPGGEKACLPSVMLGINAATPIPGEAEDFVRYALTDYLEGMDYCSGIPICRDVLLGMEVNSETDEAGNPKEGVYMSFGFSAASPADSERISLSLEWQEPEVYERYNAILDSLDAVNVCEQELFAAVLEEGAPALTGEKTIEEAVDAIAKKVQLYLAE